MRTRLLLCLVMAGCSTIRSQIGIDPGEQFVLGGGQRGSFTADLVNVGAVSVEVLDVTAEGDTVFVARLAPGAAASTPFGAGSAALLVNRSDRDAMVQATIRGETSLGMGYQTTK